MLYRVVRPFPLSLDGLTLIDLNAGDERSEWGGMEDGLVAEGYIEAVVAPVAPVAEMPAAPPQPQQETRRRKGR